MSTMRMVFEKDWSWKLLPNVQVDSPLNHEQLSTSGDTTALKNTMKNHLRRSDTHRTIIASAASRRNLQEHLKTHAGDKCSKSPKTFDYGNSIKIEPKMITCGRKADWKLGPDVTLKVMVTRLTLEQLNIIRKPTVPKNPIRKHLRRSDTHRTVIASAASRKNLQRRLETHTEKSFRCSKGPNSCDYGGSLKIEPKMQNCAGKSTNPKYFCSRRSSTEISSAKRRKSSQTHIKSHTQYKCSECRRIFPYGSTLKLHSRVHTGERPYSCEICHRSFVDVARLNRHKSTHSAQKQYKCSECAKLFTRSDALRIHLFTHSGEKRHKCKLCKKRFTRSDHLKNHLRVHTGETPYACSMCPKKYINSSSLHAHLKIHRGVKTHTCQFCRKGFYKLESLETHLRTHTAEKPYACDICKMSFKDLSTLRKHRRTHTGEKPYTCNVCLKSFADSSNIKKHVNIHTGDKLYTCSICMVSFADSATLKKHIPLHTREEPFKCGLCYRSFTNRTVLQIHVLRHTGESTL